MNSSIFKAAWILLSFVGALLFFIKSDDMTGAWGEVLGTLCILSFIGAIVFTSQKRKA